MLLKLIETKKGATNKELARMTDQINEIYNKHR